MILNEFLNFRLGVEFEDKYNALAVKEVLENKEKYPLIAEEIVSHDEDVRYAEAEDTYEFMFFDCDDVEWCAGYDETMELYRAFVRAFAKDMKEKEIDVKYASFGLNYFERVNTHDVLRYSLYHFFGENYISMFPSQTEFGRTMYYPAVPGKKSLTWGSVETYNRSYSSENEKLLQKVAEGFRALADNDFFFANRFDNDGLKENPVKLENGEVGYPCDCYEIRIGENFLRFFSTERGFDALSALRFPILESLTEEQRASDIVKKIESIC